MVTVSRQASGAARALVSTPVISKAACSWVESESMIRSYTSATANASPKSPRLVQTLAEPDWHHPHRRRRPTSSEICKLTSTVVVSAATS